jgi:hypothetical protein
MERKNPFQRERRAPRRPYEKPQWQIEEEKAKLELDEKTKATERGLENTIENFPTLGGNPVVTPPSIWSSGRKFSELASEWKATDEQNKEDDERQKNREIETKRDDMFQLPRFRNVRRFAEPEDEYYDEEENVPQEKKEDAEEEGEEWTVVDNTRYRKPKPEFDFGDDELDNYNETEGDGTVWGASEAHETCWDDRH